MFRFITIMSILAALMFPFFTAATTNHAKLQYYRQKAENVNEPLDVRLSAYDTLCIYDKDETAMHKLNKAELLIDDKKYRDAILLLGDVRSGLKSLTVDSRCRTLYDLGVCYIRMGSYQRCRRIAETLLGLEKPDSLRLYDVKAAIMQYDCDSKFGHPENAIPLLNQVSEVIGKFNMSDPESRSTLCKLTIVQSCAYYETGDMENALAYCNKAKGIETPDNKITIDMTLAMIYNGLGETIIAEELYDNVIKESSEGVNRLVAMGNLLEIARRQSHYGHIIELYECYKAECDSSQHYMLVSNINEVAALAYAAVGDYRKAYEAEQIRSSSLEKQVDLGIVSDYQLNDAEPDEPESNHVTSSGLIALMCVTIVLLVIVSVMAIILIRNKRKRPNTELTPLLHDAMPDETKEQRLRRKHPNLDNTSIKLCNYIEAGLTAKEIAELLNRSPRGIETAKYRLRKKLGLDSDISTAEYLKGI